MLAYFGETWHLYDWLFSGVAPEAIAMQPDPLRHPLVFYVGHTAAFYVNKLRLAGLWQDGVDAHLDQLFARGVDPATANDLQTLAWPTLAEALRYRGTVFDRVRLFIEGLDVCGAITPSDPLWSLAMSLEHDRIHFETSSVLIRQLPLDVVTRPPGWVYADTAGEPPPLAWIAVPPRSVELGRPASGATFGWDNEYGQLAADVSAFVATQNLISNRDYFGFVSDEGYARRDLWSEAGWRWRSRQAVERPRFWTGSVSNPRYRAMFDELEMPWSWPVEVCAHEAEAFCRWLGGGARLLREVEHAALALDAPRDSTGDSIAHPGYNLNLRYGSPCPVASLPSGRTPLGFNDVFGNVWQWFGDDFQPLPGFVPHPYYPEFSQPYFDRDHAALGGGAWASTGASASRLYRLWFRRHFFQHAGFRVARDV
ncbi:MAG: 5-histidylcysteine sulfoxide synthase [Myxococcales bacterium]|nr:5-histidylcysteine sulfoxide synthase [Myxococcales bacterium]